MSAHTQRVPTFGPPSRMSDSNSRLIAFGLDEDGDEACNIEIHCAHEDPDVERAMICGAVRACNTHDDLLGALRVAEALLGSVAFVATEGDTTRPLRQIRAAIAKATTP